MKDSLYEQAVSQRFTFANRIPKNQVFGNITEVRLRALDWQSREEAISDQW